MKIMSAGALSRILARARAKRKKIVFTNGCFDILHMGHITYLKKARRLGDILVIGLNSDKSVKSIKGKARPINSQRDRAQVLASLSFVDYVTIFGDDTPERLIRKLKPHILVKGGDWKGRIIAGSAFIRSLGGRVITIPFVKGYSTTKLINKLKK
jgi:rfaE bifunctional protein nucleotidyltransferase chain/domain